MTERATGEREGLYSTFLSIWGEDEPHFLVQSPLGCRTSATTQCQPAHWQHLAQTEPNPEERALLETKGEKSGNEDQGSPSSPLLILNYFVYVTYDVEIWDHMEQ